MTYVVTRAGKRLSLLDPDPALIEWGDLAERLKRVPRFAGMDAMDQDVARHTLLVEALCPGFAKPYALLHDAHEGYLGDPITPWKQAVIALARTPEEGRAALEAMMRPHELLQKAIHAKAGLAYPPRPEVAHAIEIADQRAYMAEVKHLILPHQGEQFIRLDVEPVPADLFASIRKRDRASDLQDAFEREFGSVERARRLQVVDEVPIQ